jgi:hypothetical protein
MAQGAGVYAATVRLDWGSIPAWIGAGSLLLAFRIFLRDRTKSDRFQVDLVGIWWEIEREVGFMSDPRVEELRFKVFARNGSDLPVEVTYVAWEIQTRWWVPDFAQAQAYLEIDDPNYPGVWSEDPGTQGDRRFIGPIRIPPQETWDSGWIGHNVAHQAPRNARQLVPVGEGVRCVLRWAVVTDNANRRWLVRYDRGRPAHRIRWYTRGGKTDLPLNMKGHGVQRLATLRRRIVGRLKWAAVVTLAWWPSRQEVSKPQADSHDAG